MNEKPNLKGISRYWKPGEDDRVELARLCGLEAAHVDAVLAGLWRLLLSKPRTKIVGFGVFKWVPWRRRIPTGKVVETWRLAFRPSRYAEKYKGEKA